MTIGNVEKGVVMIEACFSAVGGEELDGWESNFVSDMHARFEEWGEDMFISPKQLEKLQECYEKVR